MHLMEAVAMMESGRSDDLCGHWRASLSCSPAPLAVPAPASAFTGCAVIDLDSNHYGEGLSRCCEHCILYDTPAQ